jgi:SAM-dependent methyltransferase
MVVLEVACGAAHATEHVVPSVQRVVGVDLTYPLLEIAAQRVPDASFVEGNAHALPFRDTSFDIVCCRSSLHHFSYPQHAVSEMARVCGADGRVVLVDLIAPDASVRDRFDHVHRLLDPSHVRTFLEHELADVAPGNLVYANTSTIRLPVDVAFSDVSDRDEVLRLLRADANGSGPPTGFEPVEDNGRFVVSFTTTTVHSIPPGS